MSIDYNNIVSKHTDANGLINYPCLVDELENLWIESYVAHSKHKPAIQQFKDGGMMFLYELTTSNGSDADDRLVVAHGFSSGTIAPRDVYRIQGTFEGGLDIPSKGKFDKGHALAHSIGGGLDANLFPQNIELNRGWSEEGKTYRAMEKLASANQGTFVFSRLIYGDNTWVPFTIEYGVMRESGSLWVESFTNYQAPAGKD